MQDHRKSYWKTTLMALGCACLLGALSVFWLFHRAIVIFGHAWPSREYPLMFWLLTGVIALFSTLGLAVTAGGLLCLQADRRRSRARPRRQ